MKKAFIIYALAWGVFIASFAVLRFLQEPSVVDNHASLMELSGNPACLEEVLGVDLPDVVDVEAEKGIGSQWITYGFNLKFNEGLSHDCLNKLEELCRTDKRWSRYSETSSSRRHYPGNAHGSPRRNRN